MKKCQRCGTICQDADVMCGICGSNIANSPILQGTIEEEILREQKEADRHNTLLEQTLARESKKRLLRNLLLSMAAIAIGFTAIIFGAIQGHDIRLLSYDTYTYNPAYEYIFVVDILVIIGGTLLITLGLHFGPDVLGKSVRLSFVPKELQDENEPSD